MENLTREPPSNLSGGDVNEYSYDDIINAPRQFPREPHKIIALVLCVLAIIVNIMCLLAILQIHGKLTAHFRLIFSLASSDILIATSVMAHMLNSVVFPIYIDAGKGPQSYRLRRCSFIFIKALNTTALNISLLNLMGMAIDLYLAILRPLHYPQLMGKQRVNIMITVLWVVAIICGFSDVFSIIPDRRYLQRYNVCELTYLTPYQDEYTVFTIALICLFSMVFIYVRIYMKIHQLRSTRLTCLQDDRRRTVTDFNRNKKALITTLMILGSFILCWLPLCLFQIILLIQVTIDKHALEGMIATLIDADQYLYDLLLLNAICDPIVYAIRMPEVQFGYKRLWHKCTRRFRKQPTRWGTSVYSSYGDRKTTYPEVLPVSRQGSEMSRNHFKKHTFLITLESNV